MQEQFHCSADDICFMSELQICKHNAVNILLEPDVCYKASTPRACETEQKVQTEASVLAKLDTFTQFLFHAGILQET